MVVNNVLISLLVALGLLVPLVIKWELDRRLTLPVIVMIGCCVGVVMASVSVPFAVVIVLDTLLVLGAAGALLVWRFFRDPERECVADGRSILSAADGKVIYIKRFESGQIPPSEKKGKSYALNDFAGSGLLPSSGWLIGTAMTYLDVHVNRAPVAGKVRYIERLGECFLSLKRAEAVFQNERVATVIEHPEMVVGIVQIASRLVRNIIPFVEEKSVLQQGQRIGKIRFGSQVDLIVPDLPDLEIMVEPGDQLKAGLSIIARY